jgi:hypothetical protein
MVTTRQSRRFRFDIVSGACYMEKPNGFRLFDRLWARDWVPHTPTIAHFIGLKPRALYREQCRRMLSHPPLEKYGSGRLALVA